MHVSLPWPSWHVLSYLDATVLRSLGARNRLFHYSSSKGMLAFTRTRGFSVNLRSYVSLAPPCGSQRPGISRSCSTVTLSLFRRSTHNLLSIFSGLRQGPAILAWQRFRIFALNHDRYSTETRIFQTVLDFQLIHSAAQRGPYLS